MDRFIEKYLYDYRVILITGFSLAGFIFLASTPLDTQNTGLNEGVDYKEVTRYREVEVNYTESEIDIEDGLSMLVTNTDNREGDFSVSFKTCTASENLTLEAGESTISPGENGFFSVSSSENLQRECTEAIIDPPVKTVSYTEEVPLRP